MAIQPMMCCSLHLNCVPSVCSHPAAPHRRIDCSLCNICAFCSITSVHHSSSAHLFSPLQYLCQSKRLLIQRRLACVVFSAASACNATNTNPARSRALSPTVSDIWAKLVLVRVPVRILISQSLLFACLKVSDRLMQGLLLRNKELPLPGVVHFSL
jgi:hypothetical protein